MARPRKKPTTFPHYILLRDAAKQYRLSVDLLTRLVNDGKIPAVKVNGDFALEGEKLNAITKKIEIEVTLRQKYSHLRGIPITLVEAEKKYKIRRTSLWRWAQSGQVKVLNDSKWGMAVDESDVAVQRALHQ